MVDRQGGFLGTPIETAESAVLSRKQPASTRAPRVWEQIVTDDRGRRRLHGAFTGGFSAGYFNTVDTKEGFVPKSFRTSRTQRADEQSQAVRDFYDKDELEELANVAIETQDVYDTFASSRTTKAREWTEHQARERPIIPGDIISEFVEGVSESIGVQLLQKMGWRRGKGLGEAFQMSEASRWGPEASIAQQRSQIWKQKPKMNVQGLGFDPFRGSRAFERHKTRAPSPKAASKRSRGIAFGVGVLEDTDTFGEIGDYVDGAHDQINYYDMSDHSDDGKPTRRRDRSPKRIEHRRRHDGDGFVPGFRLGTILQAAREYQLPLVPSHFTGRHVSATQVSSAERAQTSLQSVPAAEPPSEDELKKRIDSVAVFVAKGGVRSEELVRQEHQGDTSFSFLFGGEGSDYYRWKLLDVKVTFQKLGVHCIGLREAPLTADDRGFLLGDERMKEEPIRSRAVSHPSIQIVPEADRSRVRSALKSNFVKGTTEATLHVDESTAGLRAPRPRDEKPIETQEPAPRLPEPAELTPVRSFVDWHPIPLLYKRFNVLDPLKGMPTEGEAKSRFMSYESGLDVVQTEEPVAQTDPLPTTSIADEVDLALPPPEYAEPPLDIFKSIFDASDDEDSEKEPDAEPSPEAEPEPERESEGPAEPTHSQEMEEVETEAAEKPRVQRRRLDISSDESEIEEEKRASKRTKKKRKEQPSEEIDEELFKGLSTSEFKKLLKTLKKGRAKKRAKKEAKKQKRRKESEDRRQREKQNL